MTAVDRRIVTRSAEETRRLGRTIGKAIAGGCVLALVGELGAGKTVFVQGLAEGLEVPDRYAVTSPSYTLVNEYPGRLRLFHVDLYRLDDPASFEEIGLYDILASNGVSAVEWADRLPPGLLPDYLEVHICFLPDDSRRFELTAYGQKSVDLLMGLPVFSLPQPTRIQQGE